MTEMLTPFNSENLKKYELLQRTWGLLEKVRYPWRIFAAFTLRFLKLSGYSFIEYLRRKAPTCGTGRRKRYGIFPRFQAMR